MYNQWYHVELDGTASVHQLNPETIKAIDANPENWFGTPEGAILHGKVQACAIKIEFIQYYDARVWIACGKLIPTENRAKITVTATPPAKRQAALA